MLDSRVILVCRARTGCRGPKENRDPKGSGGERECRACRENPECLESRDIPDTEDPEVLLDSDP